LKILYGKALKENDELKKSIPFFTDDEKRFLAKGSMRGHQWSGETLKKGLKIRFACGETGYNTLRELGYLLPSVRTLQARTESIDVNSGISEDIFRLLEVHVNSMEHSERFCTLTLDEMSLQASGPQYDVKSDSFIGKVTLPGLDKSQDSTKALVFKLAGTTTRWKQVVGYFFTGNSVDVSLIASIVETILRKSHDIGLHVVNVTSDMAASNQSMWS
jgi:hypothetical protein